jgi:hypothetical protein
MHSLRITFRSRIPMLLLFFAPQANGFSRIGPSVCCFSDTTKKRMGCVAVAIHKSVGWSSMSLMVGGWGGAREGKGRQWSASEVAEVSWECETN